MNPDLILRETIETIGDAYLDIDIDIHGRLMGIERDYAGRFVPSRMSTSSVIVDSVRIGWYQDSKGKLYKYDGIVWDEVPIEKTSSLDYLG
jgi:uncharacterized protein YuzE